MSKQRTDRLNSLLREVISEVIRDELRNPKISQFTTVTQVEISKDLSIAKVFISIIGSEKERKETLNALKSAAGFIGKEAAKKIVIRTFPKLRFYLDTSVDDFLHIDNILKKIHDEEKSRNKHKK